MESFNIILIVKKKEIARILDIKISNWRARVEFIILNNLQLYYS